MSIDKLNAVSNLAVSLAQVELHLPRVYDNAAVVEPLDFMMFTQQWGDTSLGFGGLAGQAFTPSTIVVAWREQGSHAAVYVAGRLAYVVRDDDPRRADFWTQLRTRQHVWGQAYWRETCQHRVPKNSNVCDLCGQAQQPKARTGADAWPDASRRDKVRIERAEKTLAEGRGDLTLEQWKEKLSDAIRGIQSTDALGTEELDAQLWREYRAVEAAIKEESDAKA